MEKYVIALDQGTTSSRCILFDHEGNTVSSAQEEFPQIFPNPGWVEHDPMEIWETQLAVARESLEKAGTTAEEIAAIGITNQRETTVVWDKSTGKPVANAIVWQCRRTSEMVEEVFADNRELEDYVKENTGLVVIGPDSSEFVWIPTTLTPLKVRDFGSYIFGSSLSGYSDEADLELYKSMVRSTEKYGGFYIGRFEASKGTDGLPQSKRVTPENPGTVWVGLSPQKTADICQKKYPDNNGVQGFFPWGINWDTVLQWLIDSGCKQADEITTDSTSWGNYSNDTFSEGAEGNYTGAWEEAKANNIYDLAGNNWEWTQERHGISYVMRGGGYNMAGGACPGNKYPAALRDPLPGTDFHSNATFRLALFIK